MGKVSPSGRTAGVLLALAFFAGCDDGHGRWQFDDIDAALAGVMYCCLAWGDYDNDGDLDLALAGDTFYSSLLSRAYRNDGGQGFIDIGAGLTGVRCFGLAWGDYDSDGDVDLALAGHTGVAGIHISRICRNDGGGTFAEIDPGFSGVAYSGALAWGDYDNDGDLDLVISTAEELGPRSTKVYRNDAGTFSEDTDATLTGPQPDSLAWGDYDNDGDLDLALSGPTMGEDVSRIYRNDGGGTFADIGADLEGVYSCSLAWGDYDSDGDLDLALAGDDISGDPPLGPVAKVYRNDDGTFNDIDAALEGVGECSLAWGDFDNDGDLDLAVMGTSHRAVTPEEFRCSTVVYRNDGDGVFVDIGAWLRQTWSGSLAWGDCDDDGDLDLAIAGANRTTVESRIYRNNATISNSLPGTPTGLSATPASGEAAFSWDAATDTETPALGLTYNLRVGTETNKDDVMPGMSIIGGAKDGRRLIPAMGNVQHNTSWTLILPSGTYFWSVQAADTAFCGSPWAPEQTVTVP